MDSRSHKDDELDSNNFDWLKRELRGATYTSYLQFSQPPRYSFDWGENGYAGCSNYGGGLLYLSAPSRSNGFIIARGVFPTSIQASLSAMQSELGSRSTFELEVSRFPYAYDSKGEVITQESHIRSSTKKSVLAAKNGSSFQLGDLIDRGCFNYRWPVTEYYLDLHPYQHTVECARERHSEDDMVPLNSPKQRVPLDSPEGRHAGTCQIFSCAKDNMFYQVLHIEEGSDSHMCFPADSQIVLTMGGPLWFQSFNDGNHDLVLGQGTMRQPAIPVREDNFGDLQDFGEEIDTVIDVSEAEPNNPSHSTATIRYWERRGRGLEAKLYQLLDGEYQPLLMTKFQEDAVNGPEEPVLAAYNSVSKLQNLPRHADNSVAPRSATFLAAIRLFEGSKDGGGTWPNPPSSKDFYDYVGFNLSCSHATGAMWKGIFSNMRTGRDMWKDTYFNEPVQELTECNIIGRSLEKILQVDIVSASFEDEDDEDGTRKIYETLVSNRFIRAKIDLKSLFWKTRFLIQTHKFLSHVCKLGPNLTQGKGKGPIYVAECQMMRIQTKVLNIVRYLIKALLTPTSLRPITPMMPNNHVPGDSDYYYVMVTIWYVWSHFKDHDHDWKLNIEIPPLKRWDPPLLLATNRLPSNSWTFAAVDRHKTQLLQWYHHASVLQLYRGSVLHASWQGYDLPQEVARLANTAQMSYSEKLSTRPYEAENEIVDRLSFLSMELHLEKSQYNRLGTIASLALERIRGRESTQTLNSGWLPQAEKGSISGPWEIYSLCHHSELAILTMDKEIQSQDWKARLRISDRIESCKERIFSFLNAEGTLVPSWSRASARSRNGWLLSEATAVLASTLLVIKGKDIEDDFETEPAPHEVKPGDQAHHDQRKILLEVLNLEDLAKEGVEALERLASGVGRLIPIQWKRFSLPQRYYPDSFFKSLESTPELYKAKMLLLSTSIPPSLARFITSPDKIADLTYENIRRCAENISIFDITTRGPGREDIEGFSGKIRYFRSSHLRHSIDAIYWALFESLADQEVQHRFLIVRDVRDLKSLRDLFDLLFYVIHPESSTCLGDYALRSSRFTSQTGGTWVASITFRSWREGKSPQPRSDQSPIFKKDAPIYIPTHLEVVVKYLAKRSQDLSQEGLENLYLEVDMSSIAISTNAFGDFSKCTIISDLIKDETMQGIVEESQRILQKFIHQPQTGRCLVFLLVLGKICQHTAHSYDDAIERLTSVITLNNSVSGREKQLYVDKFGSLGFELIHWSLNSLLKLNHSLKSTNGAISKAKEDLMAQIRDSPGKRGLVLERMCQEYLGDFEASLVQLETMNFNLEQSMKSLERYDTSLNMESERAESYKTMHQNENIEKLTYLTIVYLPITLMAGIYAIPGEHKVLSDNMGLGWFLGGIFIVSAATYVLAFYIKVVLEFFVLIWRSLFYCLRRISLSPLERSKDCRKKDCEDSGDQRARGPIGDSSSPPDPTRAMEEGAGDRITSETRSNR